MRLYSLFFVLCSPMPSLFFVLYSLLLLRKFVPMLEFKLEGEYIQLIALLKATNLVASGGEAQLVVLDGLVKCNGEVDLRKRLKVRRGDIVEYNGIKINVQ